MEGIAIMRKRISLKGKFNLIVKNLIVPPQTEYHLP